MYQEECTVDVQHICEELVTVPVKVTYPIKDTYSSPHIYQNNHNHHPEHHDQIPKPQHYPHLSSQSDLFLYHQPEKQLLPSHQVRVLQDRTPKLVAGSVLQPSVPAHEQNPKSYNQNTTVHQHPVAVQHYAYDPTVKTMDR